MPTFLERLSAQKFSAASSTALDVFVSGDSVARVAIDAGGKITWSSGSATGDATLYRSAANALKTDDTFEAALGVITLATDGAPSTALANGALAVDTTNHIFYYRSNSAWNQVSSGSSITVQDGAPSSPDAGDLWYESDTGKTLVYYADGSSNQWVELGTVPTYSTSVLLADTDNDTKIQVEESSDEDIIRFDTGGTERMTIAANGLVTIAGNLTVSGSLSGYAPLASPTLTGTPAAPTAAADTNTTQIATTAYVQTELGAISSNSIKDADNDTKIQVEESADEDKIRFDTGGTQRAVLDSSGLEIFTGGLKLDNLESDNVNTLDDYEEGTFTGSFTCQNGTVTVKSAYNTGGYTKIGRVVYIQFSPAVGSFSGNSGELYVEGMPFTSMPSGVSTSLTYARIPIIITNLNADVGGGGSGQIPHNYTQCSVSASDCQSGPEPVGGAVKEWTEVCIQGHYFVDS